MSQLSSPGIEGLWVIFVQLVGAGIDDSVFRQPILCPAGAHAPSAMLYILVTYYSHRHEIHSNDNDALYFKGVLQAAPLQASSVCQQQNG